TVFRDTSEVIIGGATHPPPTGSYYQFNTDKNWGSKFFGNSLGLDNPGFFHTLADTRFFLFHTRQYAYSLKCKIYKLSADTFTFSHSRHTVINGVTPVTEEYIFRLTK